MSDPKLPQWVVEKDRRKGRPAKYKFGEIEIGSSLLVQVEDQTCSFKSFRVMASAAASKLGIKLHCRVRPVDKAFECYREK